MTILLNQITERENNLAFMLNQFFVVFKYNVSKKCEVDNVVKHGGPSVSDDHGIIEWSNFFIITYNSTIYRFLNN